MLLTACGHKDRSAQEIFTQANQDFLHGDLSGSEDRARSGYEQFRLNSEWAWRFKILQAKAALWRGLYADVFKALGGVPESYDHAEFAIPKLTLLGIVYTNTHNFTEAQRALNQAEILCSASQDAGCGYLTQARGLLASELGESLEAENFYKASLASARKAGDSFLEADSLLNLGDEALSQGRFDEAIDRSEAAYKIAKQSGARIIQLVTQGNIGWAYYRLGDSERALQLSLESESTAAKLGDIFDEENELTNIGYIYMDRDELELAAQSFQQALNLAERIKAQRDIYNALRVLARLALRNDDLRDAEQYAGQALGIARKSGSREDELYPRLIQGQVAAKRGSMQEAQHVFEQVEHSPACPVFLRWEAEHSLARLFENGKQFGTADREYRAALATFEAARASVRHEDFQISFLTNAADIYDDYVSFLVAHGYSDEALRWADYSRARTLAEGLGLLPTENSAPQSGRMQPPALNLQSISAHANGAILFYWLGEKQSYLWTIGKKKTKLYSLPARAEINSLAENYRRSLIGPQSAPEFSSEDGRALYRILIAPAHDLISQNSKVFVIPDGSLNNLNFETLIVPEPRPHYWIEDADMVNASSLRVLGASLRTERRSSRKLLLLGESVVPSKDYPTLPKAAEQMATVEKYFSAGEEQIYRGAQATPAAYLESNLSQFSYIHFVAHGMANRLSPLDSAILLSGEADGSFKLYARDIVQHPLNAELVTISACYSAGERSYSGEGLVGLAWAFLRAGAHNVVAALWDVTDTPAEQLMKKFYAELDEGDTPDEALRAAKLSLLHGGTFGNPYYWAPFQLYTGSFAAHSRNARPTAKLRNIAEALQLIEPLSTRFR
jgi:CHAT domain-containing protein